MSTTAPAGSGEPSVTTRPDRRPPLVIAINAVSSSPPRVTWVMPTPFGPTASTTQVPGSRRATVVFRLGVIPILTDVDPSRDSLPNVTCASVGSPFGSTTVTERDGRRIGVDVKSMPGTSAP